MSVMNVTRALISVFDKSGVVEFARALVDEKNKVCEVSHDFVARLLGNILSRWRAKLLEGFRLWLAPATLSALGWLVLHRVSLRLRTFRITISSFNR